MAVTASSLNSTGPIPEFLSKVSKSWSLTPVYPKIWAINFEPANFGGSSLGSNIKTILDTYNSGIHFTTNEVANNIYSQLLNSPSNLSVTVGNERHFILATRLTVPGETVYIASTNSMGQNLGGSINGRMVNYMDTNANHNKIKISFLDTYKGFNDVIIKPWIYAIGHRGLKILNDSKLPDLRCNINAICFAKGISAKNTVNNKLALYKKITFYNCFPTNCSGKSYNYSPTIGNDEYISDIDFAYDYMKVVTSDYDYTSSFTLNPVNNIQFNDQVKEESDKTNTDLLVPDKTNNDVNQIFPIA